MGAQLSQGYRGEILIVDDEPFNLIVLSRLLSESGYTIRTASGGAHALAEVQASPPDLILLDILMPEMNGYEICQRLKADEHARDIPVLFLSALSEVQNKINAFNVGGVDYITKPFQAVEVLARVETHLTLQRLQKELQSANVELAKQVAELQLRNEELDAFAHMAAHDLKQPLSVLLGYAEMLGDDLAAAQDTEHVRWVASMKSVGRSMENIIKGLLVLAQVRKENISLSALNMQAIVAEVLQLLGALVEDYHAEIVLPTEGEWPEVVGYAPWVVEAWSNYVSNALFYGGRPPRVELGSEVQPNDMVRFWVRDDGPGLSPEDQQRLFVPFTRLALSIKGHGLGLSIVRRVVEKMGGQVGVESEPGQGSVFYFTLPSASA